MLSISAWAASAHKKKTWRGGAITEAGRGKKSGKKTMMM
jgi:hypothetical protein